MGWGMVEISERRCRFGKGVGRMMRIGRVVLFASLGDIKDGDSKVGNGQPWSPKITVKGGNSAFYSIGVGKGE